MANDEVTVLEDFEIPIDVEDNFGGRLTGLVTPPETGEYVFYITSDDHSELYLSTTDLPNEKRMIASLTGWTKPRGWDGIESESISEPIHLEHGKHYWVEALLKEGAVNENLAARRRTSPRERRGAHRGRVPGALLSGRSRFEASGGSGQRPFIAIPDCS